MEPEIKTFKRRWLMLALFCLASMTNAILWISFSPINTNTQNFYNINSTKVNALSLVFMIAYLPFSFASNFWYKRFGVRNRFLLANGLNLVSGFIRYASTFPSVANYSVLLVGQSVGAVAQPFLTNAPALIAALWFPVQDRDIATVIAALFNPVGIAIGSILPSFFLVGEAGPTQSVDMSMLLLIEFILTALVLVVVFFLFKEKPPLPPSVSESNKQGSKKPVLEQLRLLFSNKNFVILLVCFGFGLGFFNALTTLVEQLMKTSFYSADDASLFSGALIGAGLVSAIFIGLILDRTQLYNPILKGGFVVGGLASIGFLICIRPDNLGALTAMFAVMGATIIPMLPVTFECAVECTYPISEDISSGVLMSAGQLLGIVFIVVMDKMLDDQPTYDGSYVFEPLYILVTSIVAVFVGLIVFYNGPYLRRDAERESLKVADYGL